MYIVTFAFYMTEYIGLGQKLIGLKSKTVCVAKETRHRKSGQVLNHCKIL
jgi:hypothetical protein